MKVRFLRKFDWRVHPRQVKCFPAGWTGRVTRACGAAALAEGAAEAITPARGTKTDDTEPCTDQPGP